MTTFSYTINENSAVAIPVDEPGTIIGIVGDNPNFGKFKEALRTKTATTQMLLDFASPARMIQRQIESEDYNGIQIIDGVLFHDGNEVIGSLADRILRLHLEGFELKPLALFAERLWRNPDVRVRAELDLFLEACDLPITPDGFFLAFKKVRSNYTDIHSGTFDNSIGRTPSMPRDQVDDNRHRTCSSGLHFCSKEYLPKFGSNGSGTRVMVVKVSPEDVVAIPADYNNSKGRASRYEVVGEVSHEAALTKVWPAVSAEYGSPEPATVVQTPKPKNPNGAFSIETKQLGTLNAIHAENALHKYGSATNWARAHNWPESTVRDWVRRLRKMGANL